MKACSYEREGACPDRFVAHSCFGINHAVGATATRVCTTGDILGMASGPCHWVTSSSPPQYASQNTNNMPIIVQMQYTTLCTENVREQKQVYIQLFYFASYICIYIYTHVYIYISDRLQVNVIKSQLVTPLTPCFIVRPNENKMHVARL